jgi:hypothetical protein
MILSFQLTMPNIGSHNGRWTGQSKQYFHIQSTSNVNRQSVLDLLDGKESRTFHYSWGDGWGANVKMEIIDGKEAARRRKISSGFCSYEWMCREILEHGKIING